MSGDRFDLDTTLALLGQSLQSVVCHVLFDASWHGLSVALTLFIAGMLLHIKKHQFGVPLILASYKLAFICVVLSLPGVLHWLVYQSLPPTGTFHVSTLGFLLFWSWIGLHLSAEEMVFSKSK